MWGSHFLHNFQNILLASTNTEDVIIITQKFNQNVNELTQTELYEENGHDKKWIK